LVAEQASFCQALASSAASDPKVDPVGFEALAVIAAKVALFDGTRAMLTKLLRDHIVKSSPFCGAIHEILTGAEYSPSLALAIDIRETIGHFHKTFDEIYFVLDGEIALRLHDPTTGKTTEQRLGADELCVISEGVHHKVVMSSAQNRLCVICVPHFDPSDEHKSEVLATTA
jgi:mannose-6-phosphate isomerase-like protein (cupin superfamily)